MSSNEKNDVKKFLKIYLTKNAVKQIVFFFIFRQWQQRKMTFFSSQNVALFLIKFYISFLGLLKLFLKICRKWFNIFVNACVWNILICYYLNLIQIIEIDSLIKINSRFLLKSIIEQIEILLNNNFFVSSYILSENNHAKKSIYKHKIIYCRIKK